MATTARGRRIQLQPSAVKERNTADLVRENSNNRRTRYPTGPQKQTRQQYKHKEKKKEEEIKE